jgi:amidase
VKVLLRPGLLLAAVLFAAGCATPPVTPPPHAFISYEAPKPGDRSLKLGVKDLIDMKGEVTSAGSEYLYKHAKPAARDAACLRHARRPGVTIVGKTNLSEFAIGVSGSNDYFGTPVNPIDPTRVPGGSSSGSAVAVADGLADVALGTDTAGSIRVPAACCGVAGLKTTYGLISTQGVYPISPRYLDTVGPMARDIDGLVTGMDLLVPGFRDRYEAQETTRRPRIGRLRVPGTDRAIDRAVDAALAAAGFDVVPLDKAFTREWARAQRDGNFVAAGSSWFNNQDVRNERGIGRRAKVAIWFGDLVFRLKYRDEDRRKAAIARRDAWRETLRATFDHVDAIALPVLQRTPLPRNLILPGLFEGRFLEIQNTVAVNYAGVPALAVPIPLEGRDFPVTSLQLVGPANSEARLLRLGSQVEKALRPVPAT